jgi:hypothetical protein
MVFCIFGSVAAVFQLALAVGAPLGDFAMAGKFPGQFPFAMRIAAFVQAVVLVLLAAVLCARADLMFPQWRFLSERLCWGVVVFSALGLVLNLITPAKWERIIWAPVAAVLFATSFVVAAS